MTSDDRATATADAPQSPAAPASPRRSRGPPPGPAALPPDPAAYDSERAVHARARGLPAPYIAGGNDPDPSTGLAEERRYGRLLVWMIAVIVLGGFVLGFIGLLVSGGGPAT